MLRKAFVVVIAAAAGVSAVFQGCSSGGVGDPCTPEDEYQPDFPGFKVTESDIESRSFQCDTRVCLVNHFVGRVSCPYGQTYPTAAGDSRKCFIPGSTTDQIAASVQAQCLERQAANSVYCSCRCDGPDPNANYCKCPSGYTCQEFKDFTLGVAAANAGAMTQNASAQLQGSYCIKEGTAYTAGTCNGDTAPSCDAASKNCGAL